MSLHISWAVIRPDQNLKTSSFLKDIRNDIWLKIVISRETTLRGAHTWKLWSGVLRSGRWDQLFSVSNFTEPTFHVLYQLIDRIIMHISQKIEVAPTAPPSPLNKCVFLRPTDDASFKMHLNIKQIAKCMKTLIHLHQTG